MIIRPCEARDLPGITSVYREAVLHSRASCELDPPLRNVGWKHGTWLDTVLVQRALGPGSETPGDLAP